MTHFGVKPMLAAGFAISAIGLYYFTHISPNGTYLGDLFPGFMIAGIGLGFAFVPVTIAALSGVENRDAGLASGMINVSQQIGGALGVAIAISVASSRFGDLVAGGTPQDEAWTSGFQRSFWICLGFCAIGLLATLVMVRHVKVPEREPELAVSTD